ncbi:MAG: hypothetical protein KatS3mg114_0999 [Planctomycetaceae bacterium]|nr:MAG: hypothetical protein KatS3mg114_0999 [Planctomycetaceae bacterium]
MRPNALVLSGLFVVIAVVAVIWLGYSPETAPEGIASTTTNDDQIGPPISRTGPYPKAVAPETKYDFGVMMVHDEGEHKFVIRNEGEADLVLMARKEDATCQCTIGELSSEGAIPPGGSVEVTLKWKIKAHTPQFRQSATIRTNDPQHRKIRFEITGKVEEALVLMPPTEWELGELLLHEPTVATGTLYSAILPEFRIERFECAHPLVQITWEPLTADELAQHKAISGYSVKATIAPGAPVGPFQERVKLFTSIEKVPEIEFRLKGRRPGPIELFGPNYRAEANYLVLGEFPADEGKEATLTLFVRDFDQELVLEKVEQRFNSVQVELRKAPGESTTALQRYLLKVRVPPGELQDRQRQNCERLLLHFNHPEAQTLQLRVDFLAAERG